jgi:hypothetical protein
MKRLFRMFELSKNEQRVVLIVVFALLAIAFLGYEHRVHYSLAQPKSVAQPQASRTPTQGADEH